MKKLNIISIFTLFAGSFSSVALATGIPTVDAVQSANMITSFQQQLKDYSMQLDQLNQQIQSYEQQITAYKQQLQDAAKPLSDMWGSVSDLYQKGNKIYEDVNSIYASATSAKKYLDDNYGSAEFWENCVLTGCDPTSQLKLAYTETEKTTNDVIATSLGVSERMDKNFDAMNNIVGALKDDPGINASIQENVKATAMVGKEIAELTKAIAQKNAQEAAREKAEQAEIDAINAAHKRAADNLKVEKFSYNIAD